MPCKSSGGSSLQLSLTNDKSKEKKLPIKPYTKGPRETKVKGSSSLGDVPVPGTPSNATPGTIEVQFQCYLEYKGTQFSKSLRQNKEMDSKMSKLDTPEEIGKSFFLSHT